MKDLISMRMTSQYSLFADTLTDSKSLKAMSMIPMWHHAAALGAGQHGKTDGI